MLKSHYSGNVVFSEEVSRVIYRNTIYIAIDIETRRSSAED